MDFHILTQAKDKNTVNVVFHIPVPAALNLAGITWQEAVVREIGTVSSVLPNISPAELALLESGALIERTENVRFSSIYLTNTQRLQEIKNRYTILKASLIEEKQITLNFMGFEGEVV